MRRGGLVAPGQVEQRGREEVSARVRRLALQQRLRLGQYGAELRLREQLLLVGTAAAAGGCHADA